MDIIEYKAKTRSNKEYIQEKWGFLQSQYLFCNFSFNVKIKRMVL